ncbi:MAG: hypothetical protein WB424_00165 [Terracidiphilus sp.]
MQSRREFLGVLPAGLLGANYARALSVAPMHKEGEPAVKLLPAQSVYGPLDEITVQGEGQGRLLVLDGDGRAYVDQSVSLPVPFTVAGALGTHTVLLLNENGALRSRTSFQTDAHTSISEASGEYQHLLETLFWTMASDGPVGARRLNGRVYTYWVDWLLDNTNTLKGMRYFWPEVRESTEIFSATQREDGMIWENHLDRTPPINDWDRRFNYGDFSRSAEEGYVGLRRAPVENHVEMYFLEALYLVWKTTGDDAWMRRQLDHALRAVQYSTSDPYRWSKKYGLLKRGLTIDTWDFLCDSEAALMGGDIMAVDLDKTHFGVFFGDNTGMIAGCRSLAEMLDQAQRGEDARRMRQLADEMEERLNRLSWNGRFYTHWVAEDPAFKPDLGVEMSSQISLSNAYSLNRGIAQQQARAIIQSYQAIRAAMPASSPGEFYSIYPPFPRGFGSEQGIWDYVNGGVLACVAGELARGCFQHGFEQYGVDILRRVHEITKRHRDFLPGILRGKQAERPLTNFVPLDLSALANCDTGKGSDGVPGWVNEARNYLIDFPSGKQEFRGVPFQIASATANGPRVCIGISSSMPYSSFAQLPVHRACRSFYLLHACSGGAATVGKLTIHYEDGGKQIEYLERGINVGSFWAPEDKQFSYRYGAIEQERMQVAWRGKSELIANVGVWITSFVPRHAEKAIFAIDFECLENGAKWFVIGVTLSDQPPFLPPWNDVSGGMPNNWGAGCVTAALLEGLAGVEDTGAGFRSARVSPRWSAAGADEAKVTVRYPAGRGYVSYNYRQEGTTLHLHCSSCAEKITLRIPLPHGLHSATALLNHLPVDLRMETVEETVYAIAEVEGPEAHNLEIKAF